MEPDYVPAVNPYDLLLLGGYVITCDGGPRVLEQGAVAIRDGRISAVGPMADVAGVPARRTLDCTGKVVLPGLVDTHTHLYQGLARSLGEGMRLWPWLTTMIWPYAAALTREDARVAALLGAVEAAKAGTTALLDHHYAPSDPADVITVAEAIEEVGLRGVVARGMAGTPSAIARDHGLAGSMFNRTSADELSITRECMSDRPPASQVEIWPGPHNVAYADQDLLRGAADLAADFGSGWHAHCASTPSDPLVYREEHGTTPVAWLHKEGLLGPRTTLAHAIHLDDAEVEMVGRTGTAVAHCPVSNQYGADGVLRLRHLRDAGAVVGLGTDGAAYNHRQDLFECMKQTVLVQRLHYRDPAAAHSEEAMTLATSEGARLLGIESGELAVGQLADLTVVDLAAPHLTPHHDVVATLVYAARGSDVETTVVGGELVVENGRCVRVDEEAICAEARERARLLVGRAGIGP